MYVRGVLGKGEWSWVTMDYWDRPIFPRPFGIRGHWGSLGFVGLPTRESKSCGRHSSTLSGCSRMHSSNRIHGYSRMCSNSRIHKQDTQLQQDTQQQQGTRLDYRIHSRTIGYVAGLQDTQPNNGICGWTTGCTAKQDTWTHHVSSTLQQQGQGAEIRLWEQSLND